jgi:hypothetical protein
MGVEIYPPPPRGTTFAKELDACDVAAAAGQSLQPPAESLWDEGGSQGQGRQKTILVITVFLTLTYDVT